MKYTTKQIESMEYLVRFSGMRLAEAQRDRNEDERKAWNRTLNNCNAKLTKMRQATV